MVPYMAGRQRASMPTLLVVLTLLAAQTSGGLMCCEEIATKLDNMTANRKEDESALMNKLHEVAENVNEVNSKLDRIKIDFHYDLEVLNNEIVGVMEHGVKPPVSKDQMPENDKPVNYTTSKTDTSVNTTVNGTTSYTENSVKMMVEDYNRNTYWSALWTGLYSELDNQSAAFRQLQDISREEIMPLWQVGFRGSEELAALLLKAGLDPDQRDGEKYAMMHGAAAGGKASLAEVLLDHGADLEVRNRWGSTPLLLAAAAGQLQMARWLVERGADVDGSGDNGWTSLHQAASSNDVELARLLVEAGANTLARENTGHTPLDFARNKKLQEMVQYLSQFPH